MAIHPFGAVVLVQDWQAAKLLMPSAVKPVLATLDHSLVIKSLGQLSARDQAALKTTITQLIG
jgi:mRNA interferase MazF